MNKGFEPEGAWQGAGGALQPEVASAAAEVESHPVRQKETPGLFGCFFLDRGFEPEGTWQGAGGALQPEVASAAAEVESHPVRQNRIAILTRIAILFFPIFRK